MMATSGTIEDRREAGLYDGELSADTIILGFTGSIGSGSTYVSSGLAKEFGDGYKYHKLTDVLKELAKTASRNIRKLQDFGLGLRIEQGRGVLVEQLIDGINSGRKQSGRHGIVIDGIKNVGEVLTLRQFPHFYLFATHAGQELRMKRCLEIEKFVDEQEFMDADRRDMNEDDEYGQQVRRCDDYADVTILNDTDFPFVAVWTRLNSSGESGITIFNLLKRKGRESSWFDSRRCQNGA